MLINLDQLPYADSQLFLAHYTTNKNNDVTADIICKEHTFIDIKSSVINLLNIFKSLNLKQNAGFAIIEEGEAKGFATPTICTILLSIWEYDSYYCAVDTKATSAEIAKQLQEYDATYLLTDSPTVLDAVVHKSTLLYRCEILEKKNYCLYELLSNDEIHAKFPPYHNLLYAVTTSGSTGTPKAVFVPRDCIARNIDAMIAHLKITHQDVVLLNTPMTFDPFFVEFLIALSQGCVIVSTSQALHENPVLYNFLFHTAAAFDGPKVSILQTTPSRFRALTVEVIRDVILPPKSALRILLLGGECFPTLAELRSWVVSATPKLIYNIYGITELSCWSTWFKVTHEDLIGNVDGCPPICGDTIDACTELRLVNSASDVLTGVAEGELQLGSSIRKCYIPLMDKSDVSTEEILYRSTGDLVRRDAQKQYFYVGRLDNVIKRHGVKLNLDSIEQHIAAVLKPNTHITCTWQAVEKKLLCFMQKSSGNANLRRRIMLELSAVERPDRFIEIKHFPLNKNGKISREALLKYAKEGLQQPTQPLKIFKNFLTNVLGIDVSSKSMALIHTIAWGRLPLDAVMKLSFIQAGGTSFHALSLSAEVNMYLQHATDQRMFLQMLLDNDCSMLRIMKLLEKAATASHLLSPLQVASSKRKLQLKWRVDMHKCVDSSPAYVAASKCIIVGGHSHELYTIEASTGGIRNMTKLPDRIECKVEVASAVSLALVGCYDGHIYAYDYAAGHCRWSFRCGDLIKAKPLITADLIIVAAYTDSYNLQCYNWQSITDNPNNITQSLVWKSNICSKGFYASPVLINDDKLLVCSLDGTYACLDVRTGENVWLQKCRSPFFATPQLMLRNTQAVIVEVEGNLHIINVANGQKLVSFKADAQIYSSPAVYVNTDDTILIIFGCHDSHVYCLKYMPAVDRDLQLLWRSRMGSPVFATPVVFQHEAATLIAVCTTKGNLAILNILDGMWETFVYINGDIYSTPVWVPEYACIIFGCRDNNVYCYTIFTENNEPDTTVDVYDRYLARRKSY